MGSGVALGGEDVDDIIEVRVSAVMDLLRDYTKLEDNKEKRELLISEVADNLGLSTQDKTASEVLMELNSLPSSIKGQVNHNQVQFIVNIFTNLIVEGKSEVYKEKNAIDVIHQKIDKAIVEQEKRAINKQDIENDKWTDKIKKTEIIYGITWAFTLKILCTEA